jgi:peptidoglycan/xylan/chitin deacetylase (PgdA/CDA1 family)
VDLEEALAVLEAGGTSEGLVVITFDDGYRNFYTDAYPILEEFGLSATVFVVSGFSRDQRFEREGNEYMTWAEVREVSARGVRIGSHTVSHPRLYHLSLAKIDEEVGASKAMLEERIGERVAAFSYPFAFPETDGGFIRRLKDVLVAHGYQAGVSTVIGTARGSSERMILPRLPVNSWDDPDFFRAKLEGGYDWLHPIQYARKALKREVHDGRGM